MMLRGMQSGDMSGADGSMSGASRPVSGARQPAAGQSTTKGNGFDNFDDDIPFDNPYRALWRAI